MEKNEFLLFNEIIYRLNTAKDLDDLRRALLAQIRLLIPFAAASVITIEMDPTTHLLTHRDPLCLPERFTAMEEEPYPGPVKAAMNMMGLPAGYVRKPLVDASEGDRKSVV